MDWTKDVRKKEDPRTVLSGVVQITELSRLNLEQYICSVKRLT